MTAVVFLCARCGRPIRMTSVGCYGHLEPQRVGHGRPHAGRPRTAQDGRGGPSAPSGPPPVRGAV